MGPKIVRMNLMRAQTSKKIMILVASLSTHSWSTVAFVSYLRMRQNTSAIIYAVA